MAQLTQEIQQQLQQIADKYQLSTWAVTEMLLSLNNGNGQMAQFNIPELGGMGQWMQGGMTMVGDMFNTNLVTLVNNLCFDLYPLLSQQLFVPQKNAAGNVIGANWWGQDLGVPTSSGSQNNMRYAYFANTRRLAIEVNGNVSIYDTLDHQISGFSQQQGGGNSMRMSSQYGYVDTIQLPLIVGPDMPAASTSNALPQQEVPVPTNEGDIYAQIERLAALHQKGILTDQEFGQKKQELLNRI